MLRVMLVVNVKSWFIAKCLNLSTAFLVKASKVKIVFNIDILEIRFTIAIFKKGDIKVNIPILRLYKVVINNAIYSK
jgi:hypothetical protein